MQERTADHGEALREWVRSHYGPGAKFSSGRQWSWQAGFKSPNIVSGIEISGHATCEALIKLAEAAEESPLCVLTLAGYLKPEHGRVDQVSLTEEEADLLQMYRQTRPDLRRVVVAGLRGAWATSRGEA